MRGASMDHNEVDAREFPPEARMRVVLGILEGLDPGQSMVVVAPHEPAPLLRALLSELPGRFEFGPLQRGPDDWRWQVHARDPAAARTVSGYLGWDHRRMEELLHAGAAAANAGDWPEATRLAGFYATALRRHADLEDEVLFPAYEQACGGFGDGPTAHMRDEHVEVRRGIDQLLRAVAARDAAAVADAREYMQQAAIEHHAKEEEILFPAIDELFPADALDALVRRLMTF